MEQERYIELNRTDGPLTPEEMRQGWHFCPEWDQLLTNYKDGEGNGETCSCSPWTDEEIQMLTESDAMEINYYLYEKPDCECCGRPFEPKHIGKSSYGWCFGLHVIPEEGIHSLDDWRKLWSAPGAMIKDKDGNVVKVADIEKLITGKEFNRDWDDPLWWSPLYQDEADFHRKNFSQRGPNGLLRARISQYCVAHGDGPWDCIVGDFS